MVRKPKKKRGKKGEEPEPETRDVTALTGRVPPKKERTAKDVLMPEPYDAETGKGIGVTPEGRHYVYTVPTLKCPECGRVFSEEHHLQHHMDIDHSKE